MMIAELEGLGRVSLDLEQDGFISSYVAEMPDEIRPPAHSRAMRGIGKHPCDPSDLIHEAYRIEGIGPEECRAVFFDWALGLDARVDMVAAAKTLHVDLAGKNPAHPMSGLLAEASLGMTPGKARSGRRRGRRS
jgi:hypothetical protein